MGNASLSEDRMGKEETISFVKLFIQDQSDALEAVKATIGDSFADAVNLIISGRGKGRLICAGIGKAGHIARKSAATFSSIGIPAFYVHPAETSHGDFGCFYSGDVTLVFSHGGETKEVCRLLDFVSASGISAILIGSSSESTASRKSNVIISYGAVAEAGPHGIAPTTSTTVMLILGDALALACANQIGMTPVEFARNHPGGSLGKALISIQEVMRTGERLCLVYEDESTLEVVKKYQGTKDRPGAAVVVDAKGRLAGIFTDGNLRRCVVQGGPFLDRPVKESMTVKPIVVSDHQRIGEALDILTARKIDQVIVVDDREVPVGLLDIQDLVHLL